jgi:hypothetical protein
MIINLVRYQHLCYYDCDPDWIPELIELCTLIKDLDSESGQCNEIFDPRFISSIDYPGTGTSRSQIDYLKYFRIRLDIRP